MRPRSGVIISPERATRVLFLCITTPEAGANNCVFREYFGDHGVALLGVVNGQCHKMAYEQINFTIRRETVHKQCNKNGIEIGTGFP